MRMKKLLATVIATYCGLGLSPKAPGTVGSLGTLPLALALLHFGGVTALLLAAWIICIIGIWATDKIISEQEDKDPGKVVVDEVVGQLLAFSFLPDFIWQNIDSLSLMVLLLGFAFFRLFDICKKGPVKWFDSKMKNACGVMFDDVCAGFMAAICLAFIYHALVYAIMY